MKQEHVRQLVRWTRVQQQDEDLIAQLEVLAREIWMEHYSPIIGQAQVEYMLNKFQSKPAMLSQLEQGYIYFAFFYANQLIGYFSVELRTNCLFLSKAYLKKNFRGMGIFSLMLKEIEQLCKESGKNLIELTVNKHNTESISIYQSKGFKIIKPAVFDIGEGYVMDDFILQKHI